MIDLSPTTPTPSLPGRMERQASVLHAAQKLESVFLSEMLKATGLNARENAFGGGVGEDQFASFSRDSMAEAMAAQGGIGLAEIFYNAMMEKAVE